jgi:microcystin degradation protein MlrC
VIGRILLWRLDERTPSFEELRDRITELEPLAAPGAFLLNDAAERVGALVVAEEDEPPPAQLDELRELVGRDPDLYEEFDLH